MTERQGNQENSFAMPPSWCGAICRNAMNEVCVENCAIKRDCSAFQPKPDLKLSDMPRFPLDESSKMTKEERFASVTIYLAKVVDHLNGTEDVSTKTIYPAPIENMRTTKKTVGEIANLLLSAKGKETKE
jgi:hypothetical protein